MNVLSCYIRAQQDLLLRVTEKHENDGLSYTSGNTDLQVQYSSWGVIMAVTKQ